MDVMKSLAALKGRTYIGAAWKASGDWHAPSSARRKMVAGSCYLPKENEAYPLGQDAHFISDDQQTIGVADGVGGWAKKGVDSGEYARELMANALIEIEGQPKSAINPLSALNEAFLSSNAKGSSTACIISLRGFGNLGDLLHAVNVGDSGFLIIREGEVVFQSPIQQHSFNCPYQLSASSSRNTPDSAQVLLVEVEAGDIVVAGTDGLFDNLFPAEIEDIVEICRQKSNTPEAMASTIANVARQVSLLENSMSPFTKAAMEEGVLDSAYLGGKYDDITVIVAYIV